MIYCAVALAACGVFPVQSRGIRNSHFLIKLPYVYAFFAVVAANYFFMSTVSNMKLLPPTCTLAARFLPS